MEEATEKILRSLPTTEKIFRSSRRVRSIKASDCVKALSKHGYSVDDIKREIRRLLVNYKLVKVKVSERHPQSVDLLSGKILNVSDIYIWAEDETSSLSIFVGLCIVGIGMLLVMFQIWPVWLRRTASYSKYPIAGFLLLLLFLAVVRLVVFCVTYFSHPPGLWIFPNLFSDCGFFESFVPVYSWASSDSQKKKVEKTD